MSSPLLNAKSISPEPMCTPQSGFRKSSLSELLRLRSQHLSAVKLLIFGKRNNRQLPNTRATNSTYSELQRSVRSRREHSTTFQTCFSTTLEVKTSIAWSDRGLLWCSQPPYRELSLCALLVSSWYWDVVNQGPCISLALLPSAGAILLH